eukprot:821928-Amphidinium_carterae.1
MPHRLSPSMLCCIIGGACNSALCFEVDLAMGRMTSGGDESITWSPTIAGEYLALPTSQTSTGVSLSVRPNAYCIPREACIDACTRLVIIGRVLASRAILGAYMWCVMLSESATRAFFAGWQFLVSSCWAIGWSLAL